MYQINLRAQSVGQELLINVTEDYTTGHVGGKIKWVVCGPQGEKRKAVNDGEILAKEGDFVIPQGGSGKTAYKIRRSKNKKGRLVAALESFIGDLGGAIAPAKFAALRGEFYALGAEEAIKASLENAAQARARMEEAAAHRADLYKQEDERKRLAKLAEIAAVKEAVEKYALHLQGLGFAVEVDLSKQIFRINGCDTHRKDAMSCCEDYLKKHEEAMRLAGASSWEISLYVFIQYAKETYAMTGDRNMDSDYVHLFKKWASEGRLKLKLIEEKPPGYRF